MKKTKILAVLLALSMILCLIPFQASAAGTDYVLYIGGAGAKDPNEQEFNDGWGKSATSPFLSLNGLLTRLRGMTLTAEDTVTVKVTGAIYEKYSGDVPVYNQQVFFGSYDTAGWKSNAFTPYETEAPFPCTIEFEGVAGSDPTLVFLVAVSNTGALGQAGCRRYNGTHDLSFKDMSFAVADYCTKSNVPQPGVVQEWFQFSGGTGDITFDNVTFDSRPYRTGFSATVLEDPAYNALPDIKWNLSSTNVSYAPYAHSYAAQKAEDGANLVFTPTMTFKNGDYSNVLSVSPMGSYAALSGGIGQPAELTSSTSSTNFGNGYKIDHKDADKNSHVKNIFVKANVIIESGAIMGKVSAVNWNAQVAEANVVIKSGATVASAYVIGERATYVTAASPWDASLTIEEGATVTTSDTYAPGVVGSNVQCSAILTKNGVTTVNGLDPNAPQSYVFYLDANGDDTTGTDRASAFTTGDKLFAALKAKGLKATDTVVVKVYGKVTVGYPYGNKFFNAQSSTTPLPCLIQFEGADATAELEQQTTAGTNYTSTRVYAINDLSFKDLKLSIGGAADVMYVSAGAGSFVFDNVVFSDGWYFAVESYNSGAIGAAYPDAEAGDRLPMNASITFKNGDYTNLEYLSVTAFYATYDADSAEKMVLADGYLQADGTIKASNNTGSNKVALNPALVIGENAKMGTVHGINWNSVLKSATIDVAATAEVENLVVIGKWAKKVAGSYNLTVTVEDGAKVNVTYFDSSITETDKENINARGIVKMNGRVVTTADSTSFLFVSALAAIASLAAVVILKKRSTKA